MSWILSSLGSEWRIEMVTTLIAVAVMTPNLALHFDGNSVASIADHSSLRLTDEMTFEA
jgi:hypothetical protein